MTTTCLDDDVLLLVGVQVEVDNLGAESDGHLVVHLPASVHELFGQHHVTVIKSVVNPESEHTGKKAYQVILKE